MIFASPGNIAFTIFGFDIYYYGILMAVAIVAALFISYKFSYKYFDNNIILQLAPSLLLFGILGARLYYCVLNFNYYSHNFVEILAIRNGGLSIHGALIGGSLYTYYFCKKHNINFLKITDLLVLGLPLGQSIARWGNFFNSEAFGIPCNYPLKLYIPIQYRPDEYINYSYFHPTFFYESVLDFLIFILLIYLFNKKINVGILTLVYLISYSTVRILVEYLRIDSEQIIAGIPFPIIVSLLILIISLICLFKMRK